MGDILKSYVYGLPKEGCSVVREPQQIEFHQTRYTYFPEDRSRAVQARITAQLQEALTQRQIQVFLQPRIQLQTGLVCAAEALARWQWPDGQWSLPEHFLPALERTGLMPLLDFYMLEQTAVLQQQWRQQYGWELPVAVNVTADTLLQPQAPERLQQIFVQYGLTARQMELELTEHCLVEQPQQLIPVLQQLRQNGFAISMDDFGTGNSSLSLLLQLPVDFVKTDKRFLEEDITVQRNLEYITRIVQLLHTVDAEIVFEGVETAEQAVILKQLTTGQGQGWYWERPLHWQLFQQKYIVDKAEKVCYSI